MQLDAAGVRELHATQASTFRSTPIGQDRHVPAPKRPPAAATAKAKAAKKSAAAKPKPVEHPQLRSGPAPARIRIEAPYPAIDGGRYPVKRCVGDTVDVAADII